MKYFGICVVFIATNVFAGEYLTLKQAVALAMDQNHQIAIARNNAEISANKVNIGNADLLPEISITGGASYSDDETGAGSSTQTSARLQTSYTLFDGFGNVYRFKKLKAGGRIGELDARNQVESALIQVSEGFFEAASAYENLQIARELVSISQERLARAENRSAYGRARSIDVLSARVALNADSVTLAEAGLRWDQARRTLNLLLGRDIGYHFIVDTTVQFRGLSWSEEELQQKAAVNNASYLGAKYRMTQAKYELGSKTAAHMPRIDLSASYGYNQTASDLRIGLDDPSRSIRAGASFSFNLFNGFKTSIERQNARLALDNEALLTNEARLTLEKDVANGYEAFRNSLEIYRLERRSLDVAQLNFQRTQELYHLGQVTITEFREAQLDLIRAKSSLSGAKYDARINEMILMRLAGDLVHDIRD